MLVVSLKNYWGRSKLCVNLVGKLNLPEKEKDMARICVFDANDSTIGIIKYAKENGHTVITCDNKKNNVGHSFADLNLFISTYDVELLRNYFKNNLVDAVIYFASAHGLYASGQVSEFLPNKCIDKNAIKILDEKHKFRLLLNELGLPCPQYYIVDCSADLSKSNIKLPVVVKPVDCGGNRGITKVSNFCELKNAVMVALQESSSNTAIIEEFIVSDLQVNGDCVIIDSKVKCAFLGKYVYKNKFSIIPYATVFGPDVLTDKIREKIIEQINIIVRSSGFVNGILNVEFRIDKNGVPVCIEVNPRHSGNYIWEIMSKSLGKSMQELAVEVALNECKSNEMFCIDNKYYAYLILFAEESGRMKGITIMPELEEFIISKRYFKQIGDNIESFKYLRDRIALLTMVFPDKDTMESIIFEARKYYRIEVEVK